jgi:hypothetical protein
MLKIPIPLIHPFGLAEAVPGTIGMFVSVAAMSVSLNNGHFESAILSVNRKRKGRGFPQKAALRFFLEPNSVYGGSAEKPWRDKNDVSYVDFLPVVHELCDPWQQIVNSLRFSRRIAGLIKSTDASVPTFSHQSQSCYSHGCFISCPRGSTLPPVHTCLRACSPPV